MYVKFGIWNLAFVCCRDLKSAFGKLTRDTPIRYECSRGVNRRHANENLKVQLLCLNR